MIETIAQEPKIVKYLDIPIQHVNNRILRAMHRRGDAQFLRELFHKLRREIPGLVLRTSLIVGLRAKPTRNLRSCATSCARCRLSAQACSAIRRRRAARPPRCRIRLMRS